MTESASDVDDAPGCCGNIWRKLTRRKVIYDDLMATDLSRVLSPLTVVLIGIGQMAGGGAFVILGTAALYAGPGVVVSFAIGALAAVVTGICYAEFAATIPRAGSGYLFSYVTLGELIAFIVGWQVILENLISCSALASAISGAINSMTDNAISNWTVHNVGSFHHQLLAPYPDLVALAIGFITVVAVCFGVHNSMRLSNILNGIEVVVIVFCIIAGFCLADTKNWTFAGFFPYGFSGVMKGAASSFFAFIGFEGVACAGEETANPQKTIPMALFTSLGIMVVLYLLQSAALTLMVPFNQVDPQSAFPEAFDKIGYTALGNVVALGIIIGLIGGLLTCLYTMTRITYAMSSDGLLFAILGKVNKRTKTPLIGEISFGSLAALLAVIFNLEILVEFLSVGTLITYTIVAAASIILHYQARVTVYDQQRQKLLPNPAMEIEAEETEPGTLKRRFRFLSFLGVGYPGFIVDLCVLLFAIFIGGFLSIFAYAYNEIREGTAWAIILLVLFALGFLTAFFIIYAHQKRRLNLPYTMPWVPFIPASAIALNVLLLINLSATTWIRFSIWFAAGLIIYFAYGIRNSALANPQQLARRRSMESLPTSDIRRDPILGLIDAPAMDVDERSPLLGRLKRGSSLLASARVS
ncbi:Cationic amino acid transporter 4 [Hypsibius exemplaris]|uniref:Cationic amino acid transporter 4 n=1 Tax=Hypsibius exemplaris TaxID=2072580 RepID=A0A1W0WCE3_HYPEX|nr:Cationic amino acid transporter 4 [Hypsibius exemplaris]